MSVLASVPRGTRPHETLCPWCGIERPRADRNPTCRDCLPYDLYAARKDGTPPPTEMVPAIGSRRRLQALTAIGYTYADLATMLGFDAKSVAAESKRRERIPAVNADRVASLYESLKGTVGPSNRARAGARRHNMFPPSAWEGLDMDDPDAVPHPLAEVAV